MTLSRELNQAVRRFADQNTDRLADQPTVRFLTTVTAVTAGGASDGNALVKVTWRGAELTVNGYAASYTPVVGHRVVCDYIDNQPIIAYRVVGQP